MGAYNTKTYFLSDRYNDTWVFAGTTMLPNIYHSPSSSTYLLNTKVSPNNSFYVGKRSTYVYVWDLRGDLPNDITNLTSIQMADIDNIEFSDDESRMLVGGSSEVRIYDTTTWQLLYQESISSMYYSAISADGTKVAYATSSGIYVMQLSNDGTTKLSTSPAMSASWSSYAATKGIFFITNDTEIIVAMGNATPKEVEVFTISTGALRGSTSIGDTYYTYEVPSINPSRTKLCLPRGYDFVLIDTATLAHTKYYPTVAGSLLYNTCQYSSWYSDEEVVLGMYGKMPGVLTYNISTGKVSDEIYTSQLEDVACTKKGTTYKVEGNIVESLEVENWLCSAYSLDTFKLLSQVQVSGSSFSIPLPTPDPVMVVVSPVPARRWEASKSYAIDDEVYPTNTISTPFYYKCVAGGISSSTEPTWGTVVGGQTVDGGVTWEMVEGLAQPVAHMPLSPVPV